MQGKLSKGLDDDEERIELFALFKTYKVEFNTPNTYIIENLLYNPLIQIIID